MKFGIFDHIDDAGVPLGQLYAELFRARRLVVDTGLHAMHWTRQQGIDYGIEVSEVERYAVYPGQACSGSIYLDDGHTFRYQHGEFLRQEFTCQSDSNSVRVHFAARQGSYAPWWKTIEVVIYDWPSAQARATLSGNASSLKTSYDAGSRTLHIQIPDVAGQGELRVGN